MSYSPFTHFIETKGQLGVDKFLLADSNFDIEFQDIPGWQIKSVVVNTYGNYEDREKFGIRVIRNDC